MTKKIYFRISLILMGFIIIAAYPASSFSDAHSVNDAYRYLHHVMDFHKAASDKPGFLDSYQPIFTVNERPSEVADTGYIYDNALVLIAFTIRDDPEDLKRARVILYYNYLNSPLLKG